MKLISANGYGFVLVPVGKFERFRKENKIRAHKMLTYFARHNEMGDAFLQSGCMLPIAHINDWEYAVFIGVGEDAAPPGWEKLREWKSFNLCVDDDDSLWVIALCDLEPWDAGAYEGLDCRRQENVLDFYNRPLELYRGLRYEVPRGKYEAAVAGLKKEGEKDRYGFSFVLTPVEELTPNADASETDFHALFE